MARSTRNNPTLSPLQSLSNKTPNKVNIINKNTTSSKKFDDNNGDDDNNDNEEDMNFFDAKESQTPDAKRFSTPKSTKSKATKIPKSTKAKSKEVVAPPSPSPSPPPPPPPLMREANNNDGSDSDSDGMVEEVGNSSSRASALKERESERVAKDAIITEVDAKKKRVRDKEEVKMVENKEAKKMKENENTKNKNKKKAKEVVVEEEEDDVDDDDIDADLDSESSSLESEGDDDDDADLLAGLSPAELLKLESMMTAQKTATLKTTGTGNITDFSTGTHTKFTSSTVKITGNVSDRNVSGVEVVWSQASAGKKKSRKPTFLTERPSAENMLIRAIGVDGYVEINGAAAKGGKGGVNKVKKVSAVKMARMRGSRKGEF